MPFGVGIDLGTTHTVCAVHAAGAARPRFVPLPGPVSGIHADDFAAAELLPSVVAQLEDGRVYCGEFARRRAARDPDRTFAASKKLLGTAWRMAVDGRVWSPVLVAACILKVVRTALERFEPAAVDAGTVITVPAGFSSEQRSAVLAAAALAGFDGSRTALLDEPVAALLNEFAERPDAQSEARALWGAVDLGGGTLDVAVVEAVRHADRTLEVAALGSSRHNEFGGDDFDVALAGTALARIEATSPFRLQGLDADARRAAASALVAAARDAREALSDGADRVPLAVPGHRGMPAVLTMHDLLAAVRPLFRWADDPLERLDAPTFFRPIEEAFAAARRFTSDPGLWPGAVQHVLLTGGAARTPPVFAAVREAFGRTPVPAADALRGVAAGAARYAAARETGRGIRLRRRRHEAVYARTESGGFVELVPAGAGIPCFDRRTPESLSWGRTDLRLDLALFEGVSRSDPRMTPFARRRIAFPRIVERGRPLDTRYSVLDNGVVLLDVSTVLDGEVLRARIEVAAGDDADERPLDFAVNLTAGGPP